MISHSSRRTVVCSTTFHSKFHQPINKAQLNFWSKLPVDWLSSQSEEFVVGCRRFDCQNWSKMLPKNAGYKNTNKNTKSDKKEQINKYGKLLTWLVAINHHLTIRIDFIWKSLIFSIWQNISENSFCRCLFAFGNISLFFLSSFWLQNGFVECEKENCPPVDDCYMLDKKIGCCEKCKGKFHWKAMLKWIEN